MDLVNKGESNTMETANSAPKMITVIATTANPLNNQLKELTGDGWNVFDWDGNLLESNIIRHIKTGLLVQVL